MEFLAKCLVFISIFAAANCRSFSSNRNVSQILQDTNCSCDWRYFKHYKAKGCVLEVADSCGCPQKFFCSFNETQQTSEKVCVYQNKEYKVGSKIISLDSCQVCRCREGTPPYISCVTKECPQLEDKPGKDCHLVYEDNKCCPHSIECLGNETEIPNNKTCEYDGKYYPLGSKIYPADDPCQICVCNENWNGIDNSSCYQHDCMFEKNKARLNAGCIPVYHENRCCPIEFYCPSNNNLSYTILSSNGTDIYNISDGSQCTFDGQLYNVGDELVINNPCVKCRCAVPPDFTCVHQTCTPSPSNENCYAVYTAGECCPSYECMLGDAEPIADCPTPLCADESCKIDILLGQRCPTCICYGCPTPLCADSSCRIETPPGHECPTCVCDERFSELEHNNLEQVQQVSQILEQYELFQQQALDPGVEESSDDELQMMPIRMQDSEQSPISEKMVMPDANQYDEILKDLLENSFDDNSSTNAVSNISEVLTNDVKNATSMTELELNEIYNESISHESEKNLQKRSGVSGTPSNQQREVGFEDSSEHNEQEGNDEYIEREGGDSETNGDFDGELESFKKKILENNRTIINEIINIDHEVKVPPGCPTPMCEGPWCKIGIIEKCPTCICKRHTDVEP